MEHENRGMKPANRRRDGKGCGVSLRPQGGFHQGMMGSRPHPRPRVPPFHSLDKEEQDCVESSLM